MSAPATPRTRLLLVFFLALAAGAPAGLAMKAEYDLVRAPIFRIPIQGYDPRDLLRGHYLVFQYRWQWADPAPSLTSAGVAQLCIHNGVPDPAAGPLVSLHTVHTPAAACAALLSGFYQPGGNIPARFIPGAKDKASPPPPRFYVNENDALRLEDIQRANKHRMSMEIAVVNGEVRPQRLFIDDIPAEDFIGKRH